jgi:hypothetical protein
MSRSSTLTAGQRRDTGRYDVDSAGSLPGLGRGMIIDCFQIEGSLEVDMERL